MVTEERTYKQDRGMPKSVLLAKIAIDRLRLSVAVVHLKAGTGVRVLKNPHAP